MSEDKKSKKAFVVKPHVMKQAEDMLERATEQTISAPHYSFAKPKDNIFVRAYEETFPLECIAFVDANGDEEDLTILMFDENHEEHMTLFKTVKLVNFVPMITPQDRFFFWPSKASRGVKDGQREHKAHSSARDCVQLAQEGWCKVYWCQIDKIYKAEKDQSILFKDPEWPTVKWGKTMLEIFQESVMAMGCFISDIDDPRIKRYLGQIE